jgi:hypothetical protein
VEFECEWWRSSVWVLLWELLERKIEKRVMIRINSDFFNDVILA